MTTRREQILATAAEMFARRGFHGVSVAELGAAVGISGPGLYRHFASKDAMLAEMLVSISHELLSVARERVADSPEPAAAVQALVAWHTDFALHNQPLIVVQDRDWDSLSVDAREQVRTLQRRYVDLWVRSLREARPGLGTAEARAAVQATFGLLNATPRISGLPDARLAEVLQQMALAALRAPSSTPSSKPRP